MPRPERPLDPDADPVQRLAADLRLLREKAGRPSYRNMSARAGVSVTTLADTAGGRRLPTIEATLAYVAACAGDAEEWTERWRATAAAMAEHGRQRLPGNAPYLGLNTFRQSDAARFFGRGQLVGELVRRLADHRLVCVVGPSGSGKSSLLYAGLLPALADEALPGSDQWPVQVVTPGAQPNLEQHSGLLVVDQFEELFTLCRDEESRAAYIAAIAAATKPGGTTRVVLGIRADFYPRCTRYPVLRRALADAQVLVGPMTTAELREAITKPALGAGLSVERALVTTIVLAADGQPGALPLVSHALLETWRRRKGNVLTLAGYHAVGGIEGAIAQTAERVHGELDADQRPLARDILLRLCALGEGTEDTRRRVSHAELGLDERPAVAAVLVRLAAARLVTLNADTVELAHEALIHAWPRLQGWLTEDRDGLRTHRQVTESAIEWTALGEEAGALLRGTRLAIVREWLTAETPLTNAERRFVQASLAAEEAERATTVRRIRQLRLLSGALACLLVAAIASAGVAVVQARAAARERQLARADERAVDALAMAEADVPGALARSLEGYASAATVKSRGALISLASLQTYHGRFLGHTGEVKSVSFSPDGALLASAGADQRIFLWSVPDRRQVALLNGHAEAVRAVRFSPDGRRLASVSRDGRIVIWDVASRQPLRRPSGHNTVVDGLAFSPDGATLATVDDRGSTRLWDTATGALLLELTGVGGDKSEIAFSPDGTTLAIAGARAEDNGIVELRNARTGALSRTLPTGGAVFALAFRPNGKQLATAGQDRTVRLWNLTAPADEPTRLLGHTAAVRHLAYAPDGRTLVSAGYDKIAQVWNVDQKAAHLQLRGHTVGLYGVDISGDGRFIATAAGDAAVLLWDTNQLPLAGHGGWVSDITYGPDTTMLVSSGPEHAFIWDVAARRPRIMFPAKEVLSSAISPDGRVFATGTRQNIQLWDTGTARPTVVLTGHTAGVNDLAFTPDGRSLLSGAADRTVRLANVEQRTSTTLGRHDAAVFAVAISPDGRTAVSADGNGTLAVWNLTTHTQLGTMPNRTVDIDRLAFSPDGTLLAASTGDGTTQLFDVAHRKPLATLNHHVGPARALAFSPDGRTLATGGHDREVVLWNTRTRTITAILTGHHEAVLSATFSPDGRTLATGSIDHKIIIWVLDEAAARRLACTRLHENFRQTAGPCR